VRIHKLSGEQLGLTPLVRDEWMKIGLDTAPVDRAKVGEILARLYAVAHKAAPKQIIHLDSPLKISVAIAELRMADEKVRQRVTDSVSGQVHEQVRKTIAGHINEEAASLVSSQDRFESTIAKLAPDLHIIEHIREQAGEPVRDRFSGFRASPFRCDFGQFDGSLAWFDFVGRCGVDVSQLQPSFDVAKSCGWAVLFWDWAFVSAKPEYIHRDERGWLHCETGAALRYPDGFSVFAIHGVRVPEAVVVSPGSITIAGIESENNAEVRRVMIGRYGPQRYLMDTGAEEIHRDNFGILYCKDLPKDESLVMVKVVNSTPEPDGSFRDNFLRVPPTMTRARQAVAWTFGKAENEYAPAAQT
jgi:hypothetical protein